MDSTKLSEVQIKALIKELDKEITVTRAQIFNKQQVVLYMEKDLAALEKLLGGGVK